MINTVGGLRVKVARKTKEALDICSFEFVEESGKELPGFSAGSHIDVEVAPGVTRQYSLCNDSSETHRYVIAVLREAAGRGGSAAMHDRVEVGDELTISAPKNHFPLAHGATSSLLIAGGIGVTPLLCMAERLHAMGAPFDMHYCARSRARAAFVDHIVASTYAPSVRFHFDDEGAEQRFDISQQLSSPQRGTHLYVCGPKGFMDAVLFAARAQGWAEAQLHYEFFSVGVVTHSSDSGFEVLLASSGRLVMVPKDKSVVQALDEAGISIPVSCEQGVCGTCLTRVLSGEPDHRDLYLTPDEHAANDQFMPCCSRSKSARLVLDL